MTKSQEKEELKIVREWEKLVHCTGCGHKKCENCVGARLDVEEIFTFPISMGRLDKKPGGRLYIDQIPELRDKAIHCCKCGEYDHALAWVAQPHEKYWNEHEGYDASFDDYDGRVANRKITLAA